MYRVTANRKCRREFFLVINRCFVNGRGLPAGYGGGFVFVRGGDWLGGGCSLCCADFFCDSGLGWRWLNRILRCCGLSSGGCYISCCSVF